MGNHCCTGRDDKIHSKIYNTTQISRILKTIKDLDNEQEYQGDFKHLFPLYRTDVDAFCLKLENIHGDPLNKLETEIITYDQIREEFVQT